MRGGEGRGKSERFDTEETEEKRRTQRKMTARDYRREAESAERGNGRVKVKVKDKVNVKDKVKVNVRDRVKIKDARLQRKSRRPLQIQRRNQRPMGLEKELCGH